MARVEALGRRAATPTAADLLKVGDLHMDVKHRHVARAGKEIALSPREFDVLQVLMEEPGRVFSRTELCERIWQREHEYDTRTVEIFIARLRKKVDTGFAAPLIQTLRYVGYTIRDPAATGDARQSKARSARVENRSRVIDDVRRPLCGSWPNVTLARC